MRTIFKDSDRDALLSRFAQLDRDQAPLWGTLTAPGMVVHLVDQLRMTLGDYSCEPVPGVWRNPIFRAAFLYIPLRWDKNQKGPPEAFMTTPTSWENDLATLQELLDRLVTKDPTSEWQSRLQHARTAC